MKTLVIASLLLFTSNSLGQTQTEMNLGTLAERKKADEKLNQVYQQILTMYESDTLFISNLRQSQKLWIQLRDADLAMKFPGKPADYGSVQPMCVALYLAELTNERIKRLEVWVEGVEEGDVCLGSVRMR